MASRFYSEQEPQLYEDQFGDFFYDPNTGGFVSAPAMSGIGAPEVAYYAPEPVYYAPEPAPYYAPEPVYYAPEPTPAPYYAPAPEQYYAPAPTYYEPTPAPYYPPAPEPVYYAPPAPEPVYYAPEPAPAPYYAPAPEPVYYAPAPPPAPPPEPAPVYVAPPAPEPVYTPAAVAQVAEPAPPVSGLGALSAPAAAAPAETPFTLTPEMAADVQRLAQLGMSPNAAFGLSSMDPGVLSKADPLFEYAKTAPILELKGNKEFETLKFQPLPDTNYKLVVGGKEVATGSTPEQVAALVNAANEISEAGGKMADVRLQKETQYVDKAGAVQNAYADIYANKQNNAGALEFIIPAVLAAASAGVLAPAIVPALAASLGISTATAATLAAGLAAGAGTTTGKLALGSSLKDALIQGGISALTAGVMQGTGLTDSLKSALGGSTAGGPQLSDAFNAARGAGGALQDVFATSGLGALGSSAGQAANEILVSAARQGASSAFPTAALLSGVTAPALSEAAKQIAAEQQAAGDETVVTASRLPPSVVTAPPIPIPAPDLRGLTEALPVIQPPPVETPTAADEEIVVTAPRVPPSVTTAPPIASFTPDLRGLTQALPAIQAPPVEPPVEQPAKAEEEIVVTAPFVPEFTLVPAIPFPTVQPVARQPEPDLQPAKTPDEITVTANRPEEPVPLSILDLAATALPFAPLLPLTAQPVPQIDKPGPSVGDIIRLGGLASTGIGLVGDLIGGGDGGGGALGTGIGYTVPTGRFRERAPATFDPFTYGQREGEFEFYRSAGAPVAAPFIAPAAGISGAPGQGALMVDPAFAGPIAEAPVSNLYNAMAEGGEVDDDMIGHLIAYRKGGGHAGPGPVKGIGSGQEDKIPAWLSDGEYVWSAQDVADLGDGSTDEGVRRLDRMRQMVRKGAGRKDVKKIAKPQRGIQDMLKAVGGAV